MDDAERNTSLADSRWDLSARTTDGRHCVDPAAVPRDPDPDALTDDEIEEIVAALHRMKRDNRMLVAVDAGRLVVERVFRGRTMDTASGLAHVGFRKLAAHPGLPFGRTTLWRYVRVYELVQRLPWVVTRPELTVTHLAVVLGLDAEEQGPWLRYAADRGWSATQLRARMKPRTGPKPRRVAAQSITMAVRRLDRMQQAMSRLRSTEHLDPYDRHRAMEVVQQTRAFCDALEQRLRGA